MVEIKLKEILDKRGITISEMSRETGIARSTLTPMVNNPEEVKAIRFDTVQKICDYLNVNLSELIDYKPSNNKLNFKSIFHSKDGQYGIIVVEITTSYSTQVGYISFSNFIDSIDVDKNHSEVTLEIMNKKELEIINQKLTEFDMEEFGKADQQDDLREWLNKMEREELKEVTLPIASYFVKSKDYPTISSIKLHWSVGSMMLDTEKNTFSFLVDMEKETFEDISTYNELENTQRKNWNLISWDLASFDEI